MPPLFRIALLACALAACKSPEQAPQTLWELCAEVFEHHADADSAELLAVAEELLAWLEVNPVVAQEGYEVQALTEAAMDALDEQDRTAEEMVGLAVTRLSHHSVEDITYALVAIEQDLIYPETFVEYEREYLSGPDCFVERSCERMEALEDLTSDFGFGVQTVSKAHNQYLWIELASGWAMVHRNWQIDPPQADISWLDVDQQAYLNALLPGAGGVWRIQAQWTVYNQDNNVPEDAAKQAVLDFLVECHDLMEGYLDMFPVG